MNEIMRLEKLMRELSKRANEVIDTCHPGSFTYKTPQGRIDVIMRVGENEVYIWHKDDPRGRRGRWHEDDHLRAMIEDALPVLEREREEERDPCAWDEAFPDLAAAAAMFWRP